MKFILIGLLVISSVQATEGRLSQEIRYSPQLVAVVTESNFEPNSIGTFTLLFYYADVAAEKVSQTTDHYVAGIICERDGMIEQLECIDLDGDGLKELIIKVRSVGSGAYLSGYAINLSNGVAQVVAKAPDLAKDAQVTAELRQLLIRKRA